jgi:hypothetical protein
MNLLRKKSVVKNHLFYNKYYFLLSQLRMLVDFSRKSQRRADMLLRLSFARIYLRLPPFIPRHTCHSPDDGDRTKPDRQID